MRLMPAAAIALLIALPLRADDKPRVVIEQLNPWTGLELNNDPDNFQFAIVSDRTGGHRPGVFSDAVRKLNLLQPEFVMSVGDLIEGGTEDRAQLDMEWREFNGFVDGLEMPFFYLPGNHDIGNQVMAEEWEKRFGRAYYHFVYRDVLFLCLNSEGPPASSITPEQIEYAAKTLDDNEDVRWTLVFLHKPLWDYADAPGWAEIEDLLKGRRHTVFTGHYHTYLKQRRNDSNYFVLATTGGGSGLRGPLFGQFDHVVWVTMTDQGPRVANLLLEGIWDENVRTEQTAAMVDAVLQGRAVAIQPIFSDDATFTAGASKMKLTNDADVPLMIEGRFADGAWQVEPAEVSRRLEPNSVAQIELQVSTATADVEALAPAVFEWTARYDEAPELAAIELDGRSTLVVSRVFDLGRRAGAVVVDGQLDEWPDLPYVVETPADIDGTADAWMGAADCSFRFAIEEGDEYLYIAVEVTDEQPVYMQQVAWRQDGIEVRVDGRRDPERSAGRGGGDLQLENFIFVALSPDPDPAQMILVPDQPLAKAGVEAVCVPTAKGHNTEIAIPLSYFAEQQGADWRELRLNIAVDDYDAEEGPMAQIWWQPDWRDPENIAGSGTFRRK